MKKLMTCLAVVLIVSVISSPGMASDKILIGLITKTNTNPFFVKMREGAKAKADELGVELQALAGRYDGDNDSQVQAIENLTAAGARGILITPSDPLGLAPSIEKAREAGVVVIALDTPFQPASVADATFATDNFKAGELIGQWAKAKLGDASSTAKIALLDLNAGQQGVDVARDQGFLSGFGIDLADPGYIGDEEDPRIVGHGLTDGAEEGGRSAMENLLQKDPEINLVYTINEPAAAGAYEALKAAGREKDVLLVSIDGGCAGVRNIQGNTLAATSMQFPLRMAELGVMAIVKYVESGVKPGATPGKDFYDTGVELITNDPVDGVPSITAEEGLGLCWGE
jgi:fructose transport system substrate-binding protein